MKNTIYTLLFICLFVSVNVNKLAAQQNGNITELIKKAERGDAEAQNNLGNCYYDGKGVTKDYTQAIYWYKKAAEQGESNAQYNLGVCYYNGYGVTRDYTQAIYWYTKAAEQGDVDAQYNLGIRYSNGYGVTIDYIQAIYWYTKAAEQGHKSAQQGLENCQKNLIKEEKLFALYDKIQAALDKNTYNPQSAISLINEYLSLALGNDENRGELLNTLGLLYANAKNGSELLTTINSLRTYDAGLLRSEWKSQIEILEGRYAELSKKDNTFSDDIVGCWVSNIHFNNENIIPYIVIDIHRDKNGQFKPSSLFIKNESPYLSTFKDNEKSWVRTSQSFYLDNEARTLRTISGSEKLNVGNSEFGSMMTSALVSELGNSIKNYVFSTDKNFMSATLKNTGVNLAVGIGLALIKEASVSKKVVKVCTFDLHQSTNNNKHLIGKLLKTTYTMRSDMDGIYPENNEMNIQFVKVTPADKIIFASPKGDPIYIGGSTENDYKNGELWNINQQYKRNDKKKKAAIREYNKQVYKRLGWTITTKQ